MKTAIIYHSRYGVTKQYAIWISEQIQADIFTIENINQEKIEGYDRYIFLSGILYNQISILPRLKKYRSLLKKKENIFILSTLDKNSIRHYSKIETFFNQESSIYELPGYLNIDHLSGWDKLQLKITKLLNPKSSFLKSSETITQPTKNSILCIVKQIKR